MAYAMTKRGSQDNCITYEFICDTIADMNAIENIYRTIGTIAIVLSGESEGMEVYIAGSNKQWNSLSSLGGAASGDTTGGLHFYICGQNEVDQGLPDVDEPDETTIYLVPAGNTSGNLFEEYIYVNDAWEKFGSGSINNIDLSNYATKSEIANFYTKPNNGIPAADLADTYLTQHQDISGLAPKANPVFTNSISLGRKVNTTIGHNSVAVGSDTTASGDYSYAEGMNTVASSHISHAEGDATVASSYGSHAEGSNTTASGAQSHAEGYGTTASASNAHAEGNGATASGISSHAEGDHALASGTAAHAEGMGGTYTLNKISYTSKAEGTSDHVEGYQCLTRTGQPGNHAEGYQTSATGGAAHSEGNATVASGIQSHAEGSTTTASGAQSHAEGSQTSARGSQSHAEGSDTIADGAISHAEGYHTEARGSYSHAEGYYTVANSNQSHAEGGQTYANGPYAHAEGFETTASGEYSHAEGLKTIAVANGSHVSGQYNVVDNYNNWAEWTPNTEYAFKDKIKVTTVSNNTTTVKGYTCLTAHTSDSTFNSEFWNEDVNMNYVTIIGNGISNSQEGRSNAYALDWDGNGHFNGDVYVGCNADSTGGSKVATEAFVTARVPAPPTADGTYILQTSVASGVATYSWISLSSLNGVTF